MGLEVGWHADGVRREVWQVGWVSRLGVTNRDRRGFRLPSNQRAVRPWSVATYAGVRTGNRDSDDRDTETKRVGTK